MQAQHWKNWIYRTAAAVAGMTLAAGIPAPAQAAQGTVQVYTEMGARTYHSPSGCVTVYDVAVGQHLVNHSDAAVSIYSFPDCEGRPNGSAIPGGSVENEFASFKVHTP